MELERDKFFCECAGHAAHRRVTGVRGCWQFAALLLLLLLPLLRRLQMLLRRDSRLFVEISLLSCTERLRGAGAGGCASGVFETDRGGCCCCCCCLSHALLDGGAAGESCCTAAAGGGRLVRRSLLANIASFDSAEATGPAAAAVVVMDCFRRLGADVEGRSMSTSGDHLWFALLLVFARGAPLMSQEEAVFSLLSFLHSALLCI